MILRTIGMRYLRVFRDWNRNLRVGPLRLSKTSLREDFFMSYAGPL